MGHRHPHPHDHPHAPGDPQHDDAPAPGPPGAPAPASDTALSLMTLRALCAAIAQRRIYPPQHPLSSRALTTLRLYLDRVLESTGEWRLALVGGLLLAGGQRLDDRDDATAPFAADLQARGIDTLVFRRGADIEELRRLISLMILDPRVFTPGAGLPERMAQEGIRSIEAGRLVLDDRRDDESRQAAHDETGKDVSEAYDHAVRFIEDAILGFREGRRISLQDAEAFVSSMVKQIQQDRSPCLILTTLKSHHAYTFTHIINVCILTLAQVEALGADAATLRDFGIAAMMHDIGKSVLPRDILSKPGKLTPEEFALMQRHPQDGVHILHETSGVPDLALIVAFEHHMRYNHGGYPRLTRSRPLHPCSLMTNLSDTYDAMRSRRSYQKEFPPEKVATLLTERSGTDFHPELTAAFLQMMGAYPPGTRVRLDTGEEGVVVRTNPANPYRPVLRLLRDASGGLVRRLEVVDLLDKEQIGGRYARNILKSIHSGAQPVESAAQPPHSGQLAPKKT